MNSLHQLRSSPCYRIRRIERKRLFRRAISVLSLDRVCRNVLAEAEQAGRGVGLV